MFVVMVGLVSSGEIYSFVCIHLVPLITVRVCATDFIDSPS